MTEPVPVELPHALVEAVKEQRAILFLGAGASKNALHPKGVAIPDGDSLRDLLCDQFLGGGLKTQPLAQVADLCMNETAFGTVQGFIRDLFLPFQPAPFHQLIPSFQWHAIVTTNFDLIIERAYQTTRGARQQLVPFVKNGQPVETELKKAVNGLQYLKLHGCIDHFLDTDIPLILSTEQYVKYDRNRTRLFNRLRDLAFELPVVFCGYRIGDPHVQTILFDLFDLGTVRPAYFVVLPHFTDVEQRYWTKHRLFPIKATSESFLRALDAAIPAAGRALPLAMGGGGSTLRSHYRVPQATESAELQAFLQRDVDHVRRGMPVLAQDPQAFYRGFDTGWGAIEAGLDVRRLVGDTALVDAVLSEDTGGSGAQLVVVKGPAGNGKTVLLKRIAWEAANEYEKLVLYLRPDGAIRIDPLREIFTFTGKRCYLFVDRAATRSEELRALLESCQRAPFPVTVFCAERDNEWNARCEDLDPFVAAEYPVRFLSEKEIHALLEKLEKHKALHRLEAMTYSERIDAFLKRAERQLLVALHEATLGKPFVEIVVDEYNRILPPEAQTLYLDVCTLNRLGVGVRAGLISRIGGVRFEDFRSRFLRPLQYVVRAYEDKYLGDFVYVARHQHVAELVFDNVLTDAEARYTQLVRLVRGMNIDYSTDLQAFRTLIRARMIVETFASQELGRKFYEVLQTIVGVDPYLLQQMGLFEMRHAGGDLGRAEAALRKALELAPHDRSIQHSFANLARQQAQATKNPALREAYRRRAKERLDGLVGLGAKQPHGYYTAAQLALDELRDVLERDPGGLREPLTERHALDLVKRVEMYVGDGLQRFPDDTHLMAVEADYRELMNQHQQAEEILRRAFQVNPRQDWVANRLARRLIDSGRIDEAKKVLRQCVNENPGSKSANWSLARLYMDHGDAAERSRIADHLRRSFSEGDSNRDAQFWYARELFLQGRQDDGMALFRRLSQVPVPAELRGKTRGVVRTAEGDVARFDGSVVKKEESYLFVKTGEFASDVFGHVSAFSEADWGAIRQGSIVTITVGFTMRGPVVGEGVLQR